jgi:4-amino-4-deoxy-L-arabinose transferase-like glycosyltransferase
VFALHLLWIGSLKKLRAPDLAVGIGVALLIGLPWYVAMYMLHGQAFVDGFIIENNLARFAKPLHKSQTGQWFSYFRNVPIMLAFFLPWSTFLPQAIKGNWRANDGAKLLTTWLAVVFVFFSISKTQNFTYTYPVFPAAAVLVGAMLSRAAKGERESVRGVSVGLWVGLGIGLLIGAAMPVFALKKFPAAIIPAAVMGASIALPFVISLIRRARVTDVAWVTSVGMMVFTLALVCTAMPMVAPYKSTKLISQRISSLPTARVVTYKLWRPGLLYYLNRKPVDVDDPAKIHKLMSSDTPTLMICSDRDKLQVERDLTRLVLEAGDLEVYVNQAYVRKNK